MIAREGGEENRSSEGRKGGGEFLVLLFAICVEKLAVLIFINLICWGNLLYEMILLASIHLSSYLP